VSVIEKQPPIYAVQCDHSRCFRVFLPDEGFDRRSRDLARVAARRAGWQVRPLRGKGSRSGPDLCPTHRAGTEES
jgi:hypothetical protein